MSILPTCYPDSKYGTACICLLVLLLSGGCSGHEESATKKHSSKVKQTVNRPDQSGFIGYERTSYKEALARYLPISKRKSQSISAKELLGAAGRAVEADDYEAGTVLSERFLEMKPNAPLGYYFRGKSRYNSLDGSPKQALADFKKSISLGLKKSDASQAYECMARIYYDEKNIDQAIEALSKAIEIDPANTSTYRYRAVMYADKGDNQKAEADYNKCLELNSYSLIALFNRAKLFESTGENERALKDYDELIHKMLTKRKHDRHGEKLALAYKTKATIHAKLNDHKKSIEAISEAIKISKVVADEYTFRADQYMVLGDYHSAVKDYSKAISLSPEFARTAYLGRGQAYEKLKESELAKADFEMAEKIKQKPAEKPIFQIKRKK